MQSWRRWSSSASAATSPASASTSTTPTSPVSPASARVGLSSSASSASPASSVFLPVLAKINLALLTYMVGTLLSLGQQASKDFVSQLIWSPNGWDDLQTACRTKEHDSRQQTMHIHFYHRSFLFHTVIHLAQPVLNWENCIVVSLNGTIVENEIYTYILGWMWTF